MKALTLTLTLLVAFAAGAIAAQTTSTQKGKKFSAKSNSQRNVPHYFGYY